MGNLVGALGKGIVAIAALVLAGGLFLAFMTMGPQRQAPVALVPTPSPSQAAAPTATPQGQEPTGPLPTATAIPENTPIYIENIGLLGPDPTYEGAVSGSESAIIGVAKRQLPARWNTPDGKRPPVYWGLPRNERLKYGIFTPLAVQVERYLYNPQSERELIVAMPGGQVGVDSQKVGASDSSPVFEVGERFLAFVSRYPDPAIRDSALVEGKAFWLPGSKHVISAEGRATNRFVDLPLEEVVGKIEAAAARKR